MDKSASSLFVKTARTFVAENAFIAVVFRTSGSSRTALRLVDVETESFLGGVVFAHPPGFCVALHGQDQLD